MSSLSLVQRLSTHRTLAPIPQPEIEWIARHGELRHFDSAAILTPKQSPVEGLHIVLSGHLTIHVDQGSGRRKIMEWMGEIERALSARREVAKIQKGDDIAVAFKESMENKILIGFI